MSSLRYNVDYTDPAKEVSTGVHENSADDPVDFPFTCDHTKGADSATIRSDINTYLGTQGRTGYDPTQAYIPDGNHAGPIIIDSTNGDRVFKLKVEIDGQGDPYLSLKEVTA